MNKTTKDKKSYIFGQMINETKEISAVYLCSLKANGVAYKFWILKLVQHLKKILSWRFRPAILFLRLPYFFKHEEIIHLDNWISQQIENVLRGQQKCLLKCWPKWPIFGFQIWLTLSTTKLSGAYVGQYTQNHIVWKN